MIPSSLKFTIMAVVGAKKYCKLKNKFWKASKNCILVTDKAEFTCNAKFIHNTLTVRFILSRMDVSTQNCFRLRSANFEINLLSRPPVSLLGIRGFFSDCFQNWHACRDDKAVCIVSKNRLLGLHCDADSAISCHCVRWPRLGFRLHALKR